MSAIYRYEGVFSQLLVAPAGRPSGFPDQHRPVSELEDSFLGSALEAPVSSCRDCDDAQFVKN